MAKEKPPVAGIHPLLRGGSVVRLAGWAGAALLAVGLLALTAQTEIGNERLQSVLALVSPQLAVAKSETPPDTDAEVRRLETLVVALTDDRERLHTRIASLERKLEDTTGSIKQQQASLAAKVAAAAVPPAPPPAPAAPPPQQQVVPILAPLSMPATVESVASWPDKSVAKPAPESTPAEQSQPARVALAPVDEPAAAPEAPRKPEIGIDLGGAATLDILNARWTAVKANFGPQLNGLYPRAQASTRSGSANYRLLAGPIPNNASAAQICAHFITNRITCRTVRFEGERLVQR